MMHCQKNSTKVLSYFFPLWDTGSVSITTEAYIHTDDEAIKKAEAMEKPGLVDISSKEESFILLHGTCFWSYLLEIVKFVYFGSYCCKK